MSFWVAGISAALILAGTAAEASAQREAGRANQKIADNNAKMADQAAKDSAVLAARESQQSAWRTRRLIGSQKAAIAASGLDMDLGTPLDLIEESALLGGADRSAIAQDATRKAWGFGAEALNYRNQGAQAAWSGKAGSQATVLKGLGSAVGGFMGAGAGAGASGGAASSGYGSYASVSGYRGLGSVGY